MTYKKYLLVLLNCLFLAPVLLQAQYGNEWIVPGQSYYKIPTSQNGVHAISFSQLQSAGINVSILDPRRIQLWHRGIEQKIIVIGEGDGIFNPLDSILFYGQRNDGTLDRKSYQPESSQPHSYYNIYNDTTAYFLTWGTSPSTARMIVAPTNTSVTPQAFHMEEYLKVFSEQYGQGMSYGEAFQSYGDRGETWCSVVSTSFNETIPVSNLVPSGSPYTLDLVVVGRNRLFNRDIKINISNLAVANRQESFPIFSLGDKASFVRSYPASELTNAGVNLNIDGNTAAYNEFSLAYIRMTYPQTVSLGGATSKIFRPANPLTESLFTLSWSSPSTPVVIDLSDRSNVRLLATTLIAGTLSIYVPSGITHFLVTQSSVYQSINSIKQVDMTPFTTNADFLLLSSSRLWSSSLEYKAYRESPDGGSHTVLLADVDKVYNLHGYGELNPVGIKQFCDYQQDFNSNIKTLFIIGKGVNVFFGQRLNLPLYRKNPNFYINNSNQEQRVENIIPPYGNPPSDIFYAMKKVGFKYVPGFAVGRISAKTNQEVLDYLDKVIIHDQVDSNFLWRKKLLHLSGGNNSSEVQLFRSYVDGFKSIAENFSFKGKVIKTYQFDLNQNGALNKVEIADDVNGGLNVLTYFGHSTSYVTQLDIGYVSQPIYGYNNKGKYPFMMLMGCETAAVYLGFTSMAEDWLNTKEKGAIAVLGVSETGYTSPLKNYADFMYTGMFHTDSLRNKPIGEVMKNILKVATFDDQTTLQMNLHGDPQTKVYSPRRADYEISGDKETRADKPEYKCFLKTFDNKKVTATNDSFLVGIPVKNFGIFNKEMFKVSIRRTSNGKDITYKEQEFPPVNFLDTLYFKIFKSKDQFFGLNTFYIKVDSRDTVSEMREDNNEATLEYFMSLSGVTCIFPKEFSVVHQQPITFVAQATNLLVEQRQYYIELDTSYLFNSGIKQTAVVTSGSLIKWPNRTLYTDNNVDSTVYYWRVRFNNFAPGEDTVWGRSSFIYIKDSPEGWSQSEAPQFEKDEQRNVFIDLADSTWKFALSRQEIFYEAFGNKSGAGIGNDVEETTFRVGESRFIFPNYATERCGPFNGSLGADDFTYEINGIFAVALNKSTLQSYLIPGYRKCGRWPEIAVTPFFTTDGGWQVTFNNWLNAVPNGDFIVIGSSGNAGFTSWSAVLKNNLISNFGAQKINQADDHEPYILLAQKGTTTAISEKHSDNTFTSLVLDTTLTSRFNNGKIVSTRIGPAVQWGTFYQRVYSSGQDRHEFKLVGENLSGTNVDTLTFPLTFQKNADGIDYINLETLINAETYPFIRLICSVYDSSVSLDPPQLNRWQVLYSRAPEGTMDPFSAGLSNYNINTRDEGISLCLPYVFENISNLPFRDSLSVRVTLKGEGSIVRDTSYVVYPGILTPGQSFRFTHCSNTRGVTGRVSLSTFVNPFSQPEEYYSNNVIDLSFTIVRDKIPPVIDVLFDGVHIMDGDIVSPNPVITIVLNDNSRFLLMNDPNNISLFFRTANQPEVQILPSHPDVLRFGQVPGNGNTFTIEYNPKGLPDGEYSIMVQGRDVNGNKSGQMYEVRFTVINASTISNFYPYPNPFSSSTRFVFTLTGNYIPEDLKIQIMTVTGKVVREITKAELGTITIGNNKTDYAWDGTDEFGDRLANGVYLYRVIIKNKGDNFEHRDTAGDRAFKKNFGKLYILR